MSTPGPLVSVVIPAYNSEATIGSTLESVLEQTYGNLDVVVIDDGSTDATAEKARAFLRDPRVRLIQQPNQGVVGARNHGVQETRGEFVAPCDADDLWHPTKIEKQMKVMLAGGAELALVYALCRRIDENDCILSSAPPVTCREVALCRHIYTNFVGNGSSPLMRRSAVRAVGGYPNEFRGPTAGGAEDYLLQLRLARHYLIDVVPEYLVGYRMVAQSISSNDGRILATWTEATRIIRSECQDVPEFVFEWAAAKKYAYFGFKWLREGRSAQAVGMLLKALRADPVGVCEAAIEGVGRGVLLGARKPRARGSAQKPRAQSFRDCDPCETLAMPPRSVQRRLRHLQKLDMRLLSARRAAQGHLPGST